jgi:hypothetical protein
MTAPFNKIESGLERARIRQTEWRQALAHAKPDSPQAALARSHLDYLATYIAAETTLLAYLRRRLALYAHFPSVELPADLKRYHATWTGPPPRRPPTQLRLPLREDQK